MAKMGGRNWAISASKEGGRGQLNKEKKNPKTGLGSLKIAFLTQVPPTVLCDSSLKGS